MALKKRATWLCGAEKYTHRRDQLFYVQRNKGTVRKTLVRDHVFEDSLQVKVGRKRSARIKGQAANDIGE